MRYRADIDGLRAVAVIAVVLYHADFVPFSGGFVGVDVFFVISGYLITQFICKDIEAGRFSIANFYERRIRRLFPALLTVLAGVSVAGYWLLTSRELSELGLSMASASVFVSNVTFYLDAGYFEAPAATKPLLHTWSLAVEEQFYIVYPIVLFVLLRACPRYALAAVAAIALASFSLAAWATATNPDAAFYLAPHRAWELFLGAALALRGPGRPVHRWVSELAGLGGLALILYAVLAYTSNTPFPGAAAAVPSLGAALVIAAGAHHAAIVNRLLSLKWVVFVGLISYSLYLWHWPILVFAETYLVRAPTRAEALGLVAASVLIAALSWRVVERPFRRQHVAVSPRALFGAAAAAMALFIAVGMLGYGLSGLPGRIPATARTYAAAGGHDSECYTNFAGGIDPEALCTLGAPPDEAPGQLLLWGDSHAVAMAPGVDAAARAARVSGRLTARSGCAPLLGVSRADAGGNLKCAEFNERVVELIEREQIATVILAGRWSINIEPRPEHEKRDGKPDILISDGETEVPSQAENRAVFERGLDRTIERLEQIGATVWLVQQAPYVGYDTPSALARMAMTGRSFEQIAPGKRAHDERQSEFRRALEQIRSKHGLRTVDPAEELCPRTQETCRIADSGHALYSDDDHLSAYGARFVKEIFEAPVYYALNNSELANR